jgi:protein-S-isoprenylcysteine O-methyltransferase Ste14
MSRTGDLTSNGTRRKWSALGTLLFLLLAPGIVAGLVPAEISSWRIGAWPLAGGLFVAIGAGLIAAGFLCLLDCFARFALQGLGTPAPVFPTQRLVVTGWYRFLRNPMYAAVLALIFGQALVFANLGVSIYGIFVAAAFYAFVKTYEEPTLRRTFGAEYDAYCAIVPGWLPRLTPRRRA